ncbi:methylated-DNA--[protein]-cysteine S-methyltransferase [Tahibacter harae]|uniref:Methylated-DNA--[protein]-cysteine S-methyltransferase n=1 Tax=Tahibacter harae TaxID=2963937 RepID=A0ABT1QWD9_9GAMM|nr:methylated-DNA--[protein]-cysteine S-methyltransferase [Tahibacter harae]MCQ4166606.1 methylated-DNA--[protein]-cysteine S-methyltransferase [Tahibacter harae]
MKTSAATAFKYRFRAPGSQPQGDIRYAVGRTTLGLLLIGCSRNGVCAIFFDDDAQVLQEQLAGAFPQAQLQADQAGLRHELDCIIRFADTELCADPIALDIGGSAFEQQVWRALCAIPAGGTRSYAAVAQSLGMSAAARAVARACAANVLALAIPYHRVVRSDGALSGYRWGVQRKRALLAAEAALQHAA